MAESTNGSRPPIKVIVYGDPGCGKSTFAATFPKPMLVLSFDPMSKEMPYLERGIPSQLGHITVGETVNGEPVQVPMRNVRNKDGRTLIQIEHYIDKIPTQPEAYSKFLSRWHMLCDGEADGFRTIVFDSITFMELMARKEHQYRLNPTTRQPMQWFAGSTDLLEETLMIGVGSLPCNVVLVAHIDEAQDEVSGMFVRNPKAPGRLGKGKGLAAAMLEVYRGFVKRNDMGSLQYLLQTEIDETYHCASRIHAPNPCAPTYKALWANSAVTIRKDEE